MSLQAEIRLANAADADAIAGLHSESWRRTYRGLIADWLLDSDLLARQRAIWGARLTDCDGRRRSWLACVNGHAIGFVSLVMKVDPVHGSLLDALHIQKGYQGRGIGRALMLTAAQYAVERVPCDRLHLWVLDGNWRAARFYEALGACHQGMRYDDHLPGAESYDHRYAWSTPECLLEHLARDMCQDASGSSRLG